ncbi:hypothetical protein, partial [Serratia liquefaciens]|uniref:hypothetical protein n=1 Tax=Serratia liquefaciens TaxID=614 RepID=UPI0021C805F5
HERPNMALNGFDATYSANVLILLITSVENGGITFRSFLDKDNELSMLSVLPKASVLNELLPSSL